MSNYKQSRLSYSSLKAFGKSPNHFIQYKEKPIDTAALAFGRATHCWILERDIFDEKFAIAPQVDRRTKVGKETWQEFNESAGEKQVITRQEWDTIRRIDAQVFANDAARELLTGGKTEVWKEGKIRDHLFGGYADFISDDGMYAVDLKTCRDASPEGFMRDAHNLDYHLQAAIYKHLFGVERFYWIAVESNGVHNVSVYLQSETADMKAENRLQMLLDRWEAWDGSAEGYFSGVNVLDLPRWA